MVGEVRKPLFGLALFSLVLVVAVELGAPLLMAGGGTVGPVGDLVSSVPGVSPAMLRGVNGGSPPGNGIRFLALIDGFLLFSVIMLGVGFVIGQRLYGRIQGIVTVVMAVVWLILSIILTFAALAQLLVMIGLFVAAPFGTMAYLALWGFFPTGRAAIVLGVLLLLKLVFLVCLVLAEQKFLKVVLLMTHIAMSFVLQLALGFVQGFLPLPVVSIGDQALAMVFAIVAIIGSIVALVSAIPGVVNAVRVSASPSQ